MEAYLGEIRMFAGNFAPKGWAFCDGTELSITKNTALFSLLGTNYGGNGQTTFKLPDLRSRVPVCAGEGPGLPLYELGENAGTEKNTLSAQQVGAHSHTISGTAAIFASSEEGNLTTPGGTYPAVNGEAIYSSVTDNTHMAQAAVFLNTAMAGVSSPDPVWNIQPFIAMNYIICMVGEFPPRA